MNLRSHKSAVSVSPVHEALDRKGYVVVPGALDSEWVGCLRLAFENVPAQSGGTQHVEISDETPELESWRALEHHPVLKAAAEQLLSQTYCMSGLHGRNPLPGFGHKVCIRIVCAGRRTNAS